MLSKWQGEDNPRWNNGRTHDSHGYVLVQMPNHSQAENRGYVREHRIIMEKHIGRLLLTTEDVHHINGDKQDNRIENLELVANRSEHIKKHHTDIGKETRFKKGHIPPLKNGWYTPCPKCGKDFWMNPSLKKHGNKYCSKECQKKQVKLICPVCLSSFYRKPSVIKLSKNSFCSVGCKVKYYAEKH